MRAVTYKIYIPLLLLVLGGLLCTQPAGAQFYNPFFVWNETGEPIRDERGLLLRGENPANPAWSGQTGDLVQVIYVGIDGVISPPDVNGNPTGDDTVFDSTSIGWGTPWSWAISGRFCTNIDQPPSNNFYARAFNAPTLPESSFYGDSTIFLAKSMDHFPVNRYGLLAADQPLDDGDDDGDGANNSWEKSLDTDKDNYDTDGDGLLDGEELVGRTLPLNRRNLGLPDVGNITFNVADPGIPVTNPKSTDTDGDTYTDYDEVVNLGSDPTDPNSPGAPTPTPSMTPTPTPTVTAPPPTRTPTPKATPSPTPTPGYYCNPALEIGDLEGIWLAQTRAPAADGWRYAITRASAPDIYPYGRIDDNAATFVEETFYPVQPAALRISRVNEDVNIAEGDYLKVSFAGGTGIVEVNVYPPALSGNIDTYYFIGADGSTYSDPGLCDLAKGVPTPTPTPEATPSPSPVQPSPSATPVPTTTAIPTPQPTATPEIVVTATPTPTPSPRPTAFYQVMGDSDFDGDGTTDIAIFRDSLWAVRGLTRVYYGRPSGDLPVPGDYDGDGTSDIAVFRPAAGFWAIRGIDRVYYGRSGDLAVPDDYDSDGAIDIAIFRPSSGLWAVRGIGRLYYGRSGDAPIPADYDGNGLIDRGIFRQATGLWAIRNVTRIYYGRDGDNAVPGDFDGDGTAGIGIFRQDSGLWVFRGVTRAYFGRNLDQPASADYGGFGTVEIGIFRPSSGLWAIRGITRCYFGGRSTDIPLSR